MIIRRSFPDNRDSFDIKQYIERVPANLCHLCKDRKAGGREVAGGELPVCDVCFEKAAGREHQTQFIDYIADICLLSTKSMDITKIKEGEEILGTVIYPEETKLSPKEHICRISSDAFFVSPYKCRWVVTELMGGYLVSEMNTDIGFVIKTEDARDVEMIPTRMEEHPEYVTLFPSKSFAHEVTSETLAANTI